MLICCCNSEMTVCQVFLSDSCFDNVFLTVEKTLSRKSRMNMNILLGVNFSLQAYLPGYWVTSPG